MTTRSQPTEKFPFLRPPQLASPQPELTQSCRVRVSCVSPSPIVPARSLATTTPPDRVLLPIPRPGELPFSFLVLFFLTHPPPFGNFHISAYQETICFLPAFSTPSRRSLRHCLQHYHHHHAPLTASHFASRAAQSSRILDSANVPASTTLLSLLARLQILGSLAGCLPPPAHAAPPSSLHIRDERPGPPRGLGRLIVAEPGAPG